VFVNLAGAELIKKGTAFALAIGPPPNSASNLGAMG
jgi:hypothetical protein